jgi:hypothetical protein
MKPAIIQLPDIYRGCIYPAIIFLWKDKHGEPFNLNGWVPICSAKDFSLNVRITDYSGGEVRMVLSQDATRNLKLGNQSWDFIWVTGGIVYPPVLSGIITIRESLSDTTPQGIELPIMELEMA